MLRVGVVIFLAIFFLEIWAMSRLSTYGNKIQELQNAQVILELQNQLLENTVAETASLVEVDKKAEMLGFGTVKSFEYLRPSSIASAR